jgi:C4-dicarboxylate-specific signal transduction histidine kinase
LDIETLETFAPSQDETRPIFPGIRADRTRVVTISALGTVGIVALAAFPATLAILSSFLSRCVSAQKSRQTLAEAKLQLMRTTRLTMMGELTASIAHEIKQPLAAIVTNGEFCLRQLGECGPDLQRVRDAIREIVDDGNRASSIISRIRALLLKESFERVNLNLNQMIRAVTAFLRHEMDRNKISLRMELAEELPPVMGDEVQLQEVLINVLINAIEAMRSTVGSPRELLVKSLRTPGGALIQIQDSGPGLDPDTADRIFEPFFTTKPDGVGLGLSISRSIVESHGGVIRSASNSHGALFEIALSPANQGSG